MAQSPGPTWGSLSLTETSLVFWLIIDIAFQLVSFACICCAGMGYTCILPCACCSLMDRQVCGCALQTGYAISLLLKTEKFFDLTGSLSFFTIAIASLVYGASYHTRQIIVTVLVAVWSGRLGSYLFKRILQTGKDSRFDEIKGNPRADL